MSNFGWQSKANCKDHSTKTFFEGFEKARESVKERILKICNGCPVALECEEDARSRKDTCGVRNGKYWENGKPVRSSSLNRKFLEGFRDATAREKIENDGARLESSVAV